MVRMWILDRSPDCALFLWKADRLLPCCFWSQCLNTEKLHITSMQVLLNAQCNILQSVFVFLIGCMNVFYFEKPPVCCGDGKATKVGVGTVMSPVIWKDQLLNKCKVWMSVLLCLVLELVCNCRKAEISNDVIQVTWPALGTSKHIMGSNSNYEIHYKGSANQ